MFVGMDAKTYQLTLTDYDERQVRNAAREILQNVPGDEDAAATFLETEAIDIDDALRIVLAVKLSDLTDAGIQKWSISPAPR
jgi:hypothetical protein